MPVAVALALGLALSVAGFAAVRHVENARIEDALQQRASGMAASLKRSVDLSLDDVYSLADFLSVAGHADAGKSALDAPWRRRYDARRRAAQP